MHEEILCLVYSIIHRQVIATSVISEGLLNPDQVSFLKADTVQILTFPLPLKVNVSPIRSFQYRSRRLTVSFSILYCYQTGFHAVLMSPPLKSTHTRLFCRNVGWITYWVCCWCQNSNDNCAFDRIYRLSRQEIHSDKALYEKHITLMVSTMKKFYYIALKSGKTCEGIIRHETIDSARRQLTSQGMEKINMALLRSDDVDFLDLDTSSVDAANG